MSVLMDVLGVSLGIVVIIYIYMMFLKTTSNINGFSDFVGYPANQLCTMPMTTESNIASGPANTTLNEPRTSYNLLGDYLEPAVGSGEPPRMANLTSECAYIADGQRLIEKTGSYGQITNNYKHKKPDNGTTWLHELSVSFYK